MPKTGATLARSRMILLGAFHAALGAIFTFPLILNLTTHTPAADQSGDQYQTIWFFWWMKKALLSLQSPYWTTDIYFPYGTGLAYHLSPSTNVFAIALSVITANPINSPLVFNLLLLITFVVCGTGAYLLIREVARNGIIAFWGSIFVSVSPYRLWNLNHLNLLSLGWGLLTFYFFLRLLKSPSSRYVYGVVTSFAILFYASLPDALFVALFVLAYGSIAWREILNRSDLRIRLKHLITAGIFCMLVVLPGLWAVHSTGATWKQDWQDLERFSADATCMIVPPIDTGFLSRWCGCDRERTFACEPEIFLGWLLLTLVSISAVLALKGRPKFRWLTLAGIFLVLSIGPSLRIGEEAYLRGMLPYRWIQEALPYLSLSRTPMRFVVIVHLCLVVFAAQNMAPCWIWARARMKSLRAHRILASAITLILIGVVWMEYSTGSILLWPTPVPIVYHELASDSSISAIVEFPVRFPSYIHNRYMYWQTIHGHKTANGYLTHPSPGASALLDEIKVWDTLGREEAAELKRNGISTILFRAPAAIDQDPRLIRIP